MKKIVFIIFILVCLLMYKHDNVYIIPNEAIRFRIIANSNSVEDQLNKTKIKKDLELELKNILKDADSYESANILLKNNLNTIEDKVKSKTNDYQINLGLNYFPEKKYNNVVYPQGYYDSLVITLGEGLGNNWWCVLYPPLCFIDEEQIESKNYSLFIKDYFLNMTTN